MTYDTPAALRAALEQRLANRARQSGTDLDRLRRRAVFERVLVRLATSADQRWVLKGGFALEVRLGDRARATRDLDIATSDGGDGTDVRDTIIETLAADVGDGFTFEVGHPRELVPDDAGRPGWRFAVTAHLAGRVFQHVRIDVVARLEEIGDRTERIQLPTLFEFAGLEAVEIETVDRRQHFAEKLHALTRDYGDRPNTRVKDLADLVVLVEGGLSPDHELLAAVEAVFGVRATHAVPDVLPAPPITWRGTYVEYAVELALDAADLGEAHAGLRAFWEATRRNA